MMDERDYPHPDCGLQLIRRADGKGWWIERKSEHKAERVKVGEVYTSNSWSSSTVYYHAHIYEGDLSYSEYSENRAFNYLTHLYMEHKQKQAVAQLDLLYES